MIKILRIVFTILFIPMSLSSHASLVFINEIHYDNSGGDINEFVELAGMAGTNLLGWSLVFYNGSANGSGEFVDYKTKNLTDITLTDQSHGFGFSATSLSGIQNGAPDGIALVDNLNQLVQFISYEGSFTASTGVAAGIRSQDIGVAEHSSTPLNWSLQLSGSGSKYSDFTWQAAESSGGLLNGQQIFVNSHQPPSTHVTEPNSFLLLLCLPILLRRRETRQQTTIKLLL